jgi:hypothetical protein
MSMTFLGPVALHGSARSATKSFGSKAAPHTSVNALLEL